MQAVRQRHRRPDQEPGQRGANELARHLFAGPKRAVGAFKLRFLHHRGHKGLCGVVAQDLGTTQKKGQGRHPQNRRGSGACRQRQHQQRQRHRDACAVRGIEDAAVVKAVGDDTGGQREQEPRQAARAGHQADQQGIMGQKGGQPRHGHRHHPVAEVGRGCRGAHQAEVAHAPEGWGGHYACFPARRAGSTPVSPRRIVLRPPRPLGST
jgi:hypothetical protein